MTTPSSTPQTKPRTKSSGSMPHHSSHGTSASMQPQQLVNKTQNRVLTQDLYVASTLFQRTKGLLGHAQLRSDEMLWILRCNSIHTFFMRFAIDCVFLNKQMLVCAIKSNVAPWRLIVPIFKASSVIEMKSGKALELKIELGDQLHVGH